MSDEGAEADHAKQGDAMFSDASYTTIYSEGDSTTIPSVQRTVLGNYELIRALGQGGMGTVYLAKHLTLGRLAALKTITRGNLSGPQEIARFRAEAEAAAKLDHPHIASIYEIGECNGTHFISMQFVDGESLDIWQKRTLPSPKMCSQIVRDIALAMSHAHAGGVVHRDLKPGNVMMDSRGVVHIVDFGLAKKLDSESQMTITGQIMGTPSFMAPEQAAGDSKNVTALADVYAIGAILFYLLTGNPPFVGTTVYDTLDQVQHTPPPSVRTFNRRLPLDLSNICAKCLEKNPAQRYASAKELAEDLNRFLNHQPVLARRISATTRSLRWCRRNPLATAFMMVTTTMLSATTYLYLQADRAVADAGRSFHRQILTINELLVQIGSADLKNIPNSQVIRRELLQKAEAFYDETRRTGSKYRSMDDLYMQTATQLAAVEGELATTPEERSAALDKLRAAEDGLNTLLRQERTSLSMPIDDALLVYGLNAELSKWWESVRGTVDDEALVQSMRQSALTDNLGQQLRLLSDMPESQVAIAKRILAIRSELSTRLAGDTESQRRLAGAHHNLAEAYRRQSEKTPSADDLHQSVEHIELAQQTRRRILADEPNEKISFETAKGDYALGSARYATQFAESSVGKPTAKPITTQSIEEAFLRAEAGFAALSESTLYSIESQSSRAIVLRELSVLRLDGEQPSTGNLDKRQEQAAKSCEILTTLSFQNPLVQTYKSELLRSKACLYRIARFQVAAETSPDSLTPFDGILRTEMMRDVEQARAIAAQNPAMFMEAYLSLAKEVCLVLLQFGAEPDALRICFDAKSLVDTEEHGEPSLHLTPLIEFIELAISELQPIR